MRLGHGIFADYCRLCLELSLTGLLISIGYQTERRARLAGRSFPSRVSFLGRRAAAVGLALLQKLRDPHQIVGQYCRSHQHFESLLPFEQAAFHAPASK